MSDCSTEAMRPKAKTCGNCAHGFRALVTCWEGNPQGGHHAPNEPACPEWSERKQDGMCSCNKSRGYDELLERYQQLEQVAKEMLGWFDGFLKDWGDDFELGPDPKQDVIEDRRMYRQQLRELGVSLDD